MDSSEVYNLGRFLRAQNGVYDEVCDELRGGKKHGHWMWFIFPHIQGLGSRLLECSHLFLRIEGKTPNQILGFPDDLKLKSCMILFEQARPLSVFSEVLESHYGGERCLRTQRTLYGTH